MDGCSGVHNHRDTSTCVNLDVNGMYGCVCLSVRAAKSKGPTEAAVETTKEIAIAMVLAMLSAYFMMTDT